MRSRPREKKRKRDVERETARVDYRWYHVLVLLFQHILGIQQGFRVHHTHTHTHTHTRASDGGIGTAVKNRLEIVIEQVRLEGGFKSHLRNRILFLK